MIFPKVKKLALLTAVVSGLSMGMTVTQARETGVSEPAGVIAFDDRVIELDFGLLGRFQIRSDGSVWQYARMGEWKRLPNVRFDGRNIFADGKMIGVLTPSGSGVQLSVGGQTVSGDMAIRYLRTRDAQWLHQHAGWYDFGTRGLFRVDDTGEVFKRSGDALQATGNWLTRIGQGIGVIDSDGRLVADLVVDGQHVTLKTGGAQAVGAFVAENGDSMGDMGTAPNDSAHIDTRTLLHPKTGVYDFNDHGTFMVKPDGSVVMVDGDGTLKDLGLRIDTLGRVLDRNDNVVGRLTTEEGYPVYVDSDGRKVRGTRVSGGYDNIVVSGAGRVRVDLGNDRYLVYYAHAFAHPYSGIYRVGDERYSVERQTGRIWRYNPTIHRFQAQPYFVDQSGHIVDERSNRIVGSIQPVADVGRLAEIRFLGRRLVAEWGAPAAGNFADSIANRKQSFTEFIQPAIQRFGGAASSGK